MRRLACSLALLVAVTLPTASAQSTSSNSITIGRVDSIRSGALKEWRKLWIYTPASYADSTYAPQRYPVLYLLDGDAHFHSVTGLLQILGSGINGTFVVPEMIVVAIPNTDRSRDMTPTHVEKDLEGKTQEWLKTSGGMASFFTFIKSELIPHIDSTYRTAPYRVFVGHSLGGITAINALYTIPETFNAYVAIDPSLWWDDRLLLKKAKGYFSSAHLAGRSLFVGQANTITADDTTANVHYASIVQFNSVLEAYNQSGMRYAYRYYGGDDHGSVPLIAEYDALRFIFSDYRVDLMRSLTSAAYVRDHFARASSALGYEVRPPEPMLDLVGHFALGRDTTNAMALLELNAALYPGSAKAHDGLGDAWLAKGDSAKAAAHFERALSLNPKDAYAKSMLEKARTAKR